VAARRVRAADRALPLAARPALGTGAARALPCRHDLGARLRRGALRLRLPARLGVRRGRVGRGEPRRAPVAGARARAARPGAGARRLMRTVDDIRPLHLVDVVVEGETWPVFVWTIGGPEGTILVDTGMIDSTPALD